MNTFQSWKSDTRHFQPPIGVLKLIPDRRQPLAREPKHIRQQGFKAGLAYVGLLDYPGDAICVAPMFPFSAADPRQELNQLGLGDMLRIQHRPDPTRKSFGPPWR